MQKYFDAPENREKLLQQVNEWLGVPYEHMGESKSGIDCTKLFGKVLEGLGVLNGNLKGVYKAPDWYVQSKREVLLEFVDQTLKEHLKKGFIFLRLPPRDLQFGDFLFFSFSKSGVAHHSAIYLGDGKICHVITKRNCCIEMLSKAWEKRIKKVYRLTTWLSD